MKQVIIDIDTKIVCDGCGFSMETTQPRDSGSTLPEFDHIRCNYCPECPDYKEQSQGGYYEEWYCDSQGQALELPFL